jgi:hypothetical protein
LADTVPRARILAHDGSSQPLKFLQIAILVVLGLLSLAAGAAKLMMVDAEVVFFSSAGLHRYWLLPLGILQVTGPALALLGPVRHWGVAAIGSGFMISAGIIAMTGNIGFAVISLIPVSLAVFAFVTARRSR